MTKASTADTQSSTYDNHGQYSRTGILRYEKIFGHGYVSTGGHSTTEYLCSKLGDSLKPGVKVLDVGSGIGGAAFHLAKAYGAVVTGVDLSPEMIKIAQERAEELHAPSTVTSILGDVLTHPFDNLFGIVWSRDALMHIPDKPRLFAHLLRPDRAGRAADHHRLRQGDRRRVARVPGLHRLDRLSRRGPG